ncbi:MAG: drug/metabolite transporter (DMT)-like permease [Flavobacteriales bacterium]|jgi:drug/metabolite transporter (DMT)-like permease
MEVYGYLSILVMSGLVTAAQVLLKRNAMNLTGLRSISDFTSLIRKFEVLIAVICIAAAPIFYIAALWVLPLNKAFMMTSINMFVVPVAGKVFFNEKLGPKRIMGISLILVGVLLYSFK